MTSEFDIGQTHAYRQRTDGHARMAGVQTATFICKKCRQAKAAAGRKMVTPRHPRDGYICKDCAG